MPQHFAQVWDMISFGSEINSPAPIAQICTSIKYHVVNTTPFFNTPIIG
jgi:hypothetical protein